MREENQEPNLFESRPKHICRDVFHGRWSQLNKGDKLQFAGGVALAVMCFGSMLLVGLGTGTLNTLAEGLLILAGIYGAIFGSAAFLMTRSIRKRDNALRKARQNAMTRSHEKP
jgi:hypothetical protein